MHPNHGHQGHNPPEQHSTYANHHTNGHNHNAPPQNPSHRNPAQPLPKETITVVGIPSVTVENDTLVVGDSDSSSTRSYTPLKVVGDGSFGTVWLCDWHGTLPPNTPLSAMQCSSGARPEYAGKRLVAVKRMKKRWEGGWDECKRLKELESLRAIPFHPNIIPLYDFFLLPSTKELYFVFESMEGNLYQLIKSRKGKPLAGGLVSSIFRQVVEGLHHIHASGYFHRDMKPENLLVTTTGLYDYRPVVSGAPANAPPDRDVVVIIKLADFGLARETRSSPPYTEYVSTRWYRAPEVLLKSHDYSNPVDMWALGTIMAEVVNLRPLFPGQGEIDQVARICELLGDPVEDYGMDDRRRPIGGGRWPRGVQLARNVGFAFPKMPPQNICAMFDRNVPLSLVECITDLLKYDPDLRLTSEQCLNHHYLRETLPLNNPPGPPTSPQGAGCKPSVSHTNGYPDGVSPNPSLRSVAPRSIPPSHSHPNGHPKVHAVPPRVYPHIPDASSSHRSSFYDSGYHSITRQPSISEVSQAASDYSGDIYSPRSSDAGVAEARRAPQVQSPEPTSSDYAHAAERADNVSGWIAAEQANRDWDAMDVSPQLETPAEVPYAAHQLMDVQTSPIVPEYPARPAHEPEPPSVQSATHGQSNKFPKFGSLGFGKKHTKWGLGGMFGHGDKHNTLPPVQENGIPPVSTVPSLRHRNSSSTDSRSLPEISQPTEDAKQKKKEQERMAKEVQKEAERQRRIRAEKMQKEQARAVMKNNRRLAQAVPPKYSSSIEWLGGAHGNEFTARQQPSSSGPIRQGQMHGASSLTVNAAGGSFKGAGQSPIVPSSQDGDLKRSERRDHERERMPKARRREYDDDHSMSSELRSSMSVISFATVDSDPGPARRRRHETYGVNRMTSMSSMRGSSVEDSVASPHRSSTSLSLETQLVNDFLRASVDSSSLSEHGSPQPPPMQMLSLSSPIPWQHSHSDLSSSSTVDNSGLRSPHHISSPLSPPPQPRQPGPLHLGPQSPYGTSAVYGPPSPGLAPKSAINPMFKVPSFSGSVDRPSLSLTSLPPFAQLEAVADGGEYPPLSPMSFTIPEEEVSGEDS
ncbi:hypothetical protein EIP86_002897 [Pleurotus ostreatoroseus]|nr:hypothetical protein EIP86_002897 [Pleurotus ostreatoroseus]